MVSERRRPLWSVTRVCQTWVRLPLCRAIDSARIVPCSAAAKKLVFDSSVAVRSPIAAVPAAPTVSASAISVPPWRAPPTVASSLRTSSSAPTLSGPTSTKRIPRWAIRPVFHSFMGLSSGLADPELVHRREGIRVGRFVGVPLLERHGKLLSRQLEAEELDAELGDRRGDLRNREAMLLHVQDEIARARGAVEVAQRRDGTRRMVRGKLQDASPGLGHR